MLDMHDRLVEGTMSNVFLVRDGTLLTPDLSGCGVAGITRGLILEMAGEAGIATAVRPVVLEELEAADEVFLCNSLIGIWPVTRIAARAYPAGRMTRQLQDSLRTYTDAER
jgi:4-amino-4-deoxychorismate lyase